MTLHTARGLNDGGFFQDGLLDFEEEQGIKERKEILRGKGQPSNPLFDTSYLFWILCSTWFLPGHLGGPWAGKK